ncbi:MAG: alanyl-tRNA synthetase [Pseudomonadales bacterium]|jgi:alanyl-tRNA synthetase
MKSAEIREAFLSYFEKQGHTRVSSSSLVPANDPTLLFTNAGMVQFKDVFLGADKRAYSRATSSQRCVRAGGKHNDLENVGYTARHHTFFEMLGNFSFGDYFKHDAINYAWEFLTSREWMAIPEDKLWVTVYADDDEAYDIWNKEIGVPAERIIRIGDNKGAKYASDNFWTMGDTGPCGPCTEIFFDHGAEVAGGPPGSPDEDGDRYIEIWNIVFMQFNRFEDGRMEPLPKPAVDTGMGLERIAAVKQHVHSNYEIDLFQNLLKAAAEIVGVKDLEEKSLRVIADHVRSCAFLIIDGVNPGNEGRDYVLRRITRRAIRHGHQLGMTKSFFSQLVAALVKEMGAAYPELVEQQGRIEKLILAEEQQFARTLENGLQILSAAIDNLDGTELSGAVVFKLYDTYGFPVDLTNDIAREHDLSLDMIGFDAAMEQQRKRSQSASSFSVDYSQTLNLAGETEFTGYDKQTDSATVTELLRDGEPVDNIATGESGIVLLDKTPFYAESGGQAGDTGYLTAAGVKVEVLNTTKAGSHHLHHINVIDGELTKGSDLTTVINSSVRRDTALNHSATHLLHAALRRVLGSHVEQKGSLVNSERLRFDFSHPAALSAGELQEIEVLVNAQVRENSAVETEVTDMDTAQQKGAMALFGEKYGDEVRLLSMGDGFSVELCGGTHVERTGDIGLIKVYSEGGISAGVRRIEAVSGQAALDLVEQTDATLQSVGQLVKGSKDSVVAKVEQMLRANRQLEKELEQLKSKLASQAGSDLASQAQEVAGVKVLAAIIDGGDSKSLRDTVDQLKNKLGEAVVVLACIEGDKVSLVAGVTKATSSKVKAGDILRVVAEAIGGKGGGRPDMAQGGGGNAALLPDALAKVASLVTEKMD